MIKTCEQYIVQLFNYFFKKNNLISLMNHWNISSPKHLWVAADKNATAVKVELKQVEAMLNTTWSETIFCPASFHKKAMSLLQKNADLLPTISCEEYIARLHEITEKCTLRWLDEKIGWVVTLRAGESLQPGFLTCYTGVLTQLALKQHASYAMREYFFHLCNTEKYDIGVDAKSCGNIARLLPFLLDEKYLEYFDIATDIKNQIAVANCQFQLALLNGVKTPCVFVPKTITAPIDKELLLGVSYSLAYLLKMEQFKFIHKESFTSIDAKSYAKKMLTVQLEGLSYSFAVPRLRVMLATQIPGLSFSTKGYDSEKKQYYQITVPDLVIYQAMMAEPKAESVVVQPAMKMLNEMT